MKLPWKKSLSSKNDGPVDCQLPQSDQPGEEKSGSETDAGAENGKKSILDRANSILGRGAGVIREKLRKILPGIGKKSEKPASSLNGEETIGQNTPPKDPEKQTEPLTIPTNAGAADSRPKSDPLGSEKSSCETGMNAVAENGKKSILSRAKSTLARGVGIIRERLSMLRPRIGKKPEKPALSLNGEEITDKETPRKEPPKQTEPRGAPENSGESKKEKPQKTDFSGAALSLWSGVKSFLGRGKKRAAEAAKKAGRRASKTARKVVAAATRVTGNPTCGQWLRPASEIGQAALGSTLIGRIFFAARESYNALIQSLSQNFREEVTKNIAITIFTSLSRWAIFVGLIWGAHALAVRNNEPTQDWVACAILFLIMPYYFTCWFGCIAWYIGAVRKDRELMFHPLDLIYTYIYNRINAQFPRFLRVIPLLSGKISRDIIDKAMKDPLLWLNVGVSLALFLTGWILYLVYYDKVFFHATGIHFKYIWDPFIWPFLTLMK